MYRPITIPSNLLRILTVRMCKHMTNVAEANGLLGPEQFGFRRGKSTMDAVFTLMSLIMKAKGKGWPFATAFLDISRVIFLVKISEKCKRISIQAYDSVNRQILFSKLNHLGFGGKTLSLIQSMYHNDNLQFVINGQSSEPLWLTRGVKQGMSSLPKTI